MDNQDPQNYGYGYGYGAAFQEGYQGYPASGSYSQVDNLNPNYQQAPMHGQNTPYHQWPLSNQAVQYEREPPSKQDDQYVQRHGYRNASPPPQYEESTQPQDPGISSWDDSTGTSQDAVSYRYGSQPSKNSRLNASQGLSKRFSDLIHCLKPEYEPSGSGSDEGTQSTGAASNHEFATVPFYNPRYGKYPFSAFCPRSSPEFINLEIMNIKRGHDLLVGPNKDPCHPAYKIDYDDGGYSFKAYRCELPDLNFMMAIYAGKWRWKILSPSRIYVDFPWGKWDFHVENDCWYSDVGLLGGKSALKWSLLHNETTSKTGGFVVRCFDTTTPSMPTVASFYMQNYKLGRLEIAARLVRTLEQLDEIVIVAMGAVCLWRDFVRDNHRSVRDA